MDPADFLTVRKVLEDGQRWKEKVWTEKRERRGVTKMGRGEEGVRTTNVVSVPSNHALTSMLLSDHRMPV